MFKDIPGYEKKYRINESGDILSLSPKSIACNSMIKIHSDRRGYLRVKLFRGRQGKNFFVHSLVALTFIGNRPKDYTVNHKDTIKTNNHISNLEYLSNLENIAHAKRFRQGIF